ncbi:MAG: sulfurtransferase [Dehalococcoidia bacterium]
MSEALVSTAWLADRLDAANARPDGRPSGRIIEVSHDPEAYASGHLPGAVAIDWLQDLIEHPDETSGHVIDADRFAALARRLGLRPDDTLVFYGDAGGRHAARALWTFEYYRHPGPLHWLDGGREKWQREGRPMTADVPTIAPSDYPTPHEHDERLRATWQQIEMHIHDGAHAVLDVRTPEEYQGTDVRAARGGHIPGAVHIFWEDALTPDGSLRPKKELERLYARLPKDKSIAVHCQLGVRAAHTWFVLRHVLGYPDVRNYDGSWQEWGNLPDVPIER